MILLLCTTTHADYQTGLDAYNDGDYATALAEWKAEIHQPGEPENLAVYREALYGIGMLYWKGEGVEQDYAVAAAWLKQAADINHPGAQVKLGYLYSTGQGVPLNYQEARRWFQQAAYQGDRDAAYNLDILDRENLGWPNEPEQPLPSPGSGIPPTEPADATVASMAPKAAADAAVAQVPPSPESGAEDTASASGPVVSVLAFEARGWSGETPSEPEQTAAVPRAPEPSPEPSEYSPGQDAGPDWIRAQEPEKYTIQVIALREPDKLQAFIADHPDWAPFAIYRPAGNERPLWVLVQGVYADADAARAAVAAFPSGLQRREQLWIRRFGMVQGQIE